MFMDEARFSRTDTRRCWCPKPISPVCYAMVGQEYSYAYAAVSVSDGNMDSLILPRVNGECTHLLLAFLISSAIRDHKNSWLDQGLSSQESRRRIGGGLLGRNNYFGID